MKNFKKSKKQSDYSDKGRKKLAKESDAKDILSFFGEEIIASNTFKESDNNIQHGDVSVMDHSLSVCLTCIQLAKATHLRYDYSSLVRGALLHDYFNYDWHSHEGHFHGYRHADIALTNAANDFAINPIEANMIQRHMFPLNIRPPKYREAIILCIADKICATKEIFAKPLYNREIKELKR